MVYQEPIQIYIMSLLHAKYAVYKSLPWNLLDFMKSTGFHAWNLLDFMKFTRFHHEICQISPWNLPDFMVYHWMLYFSIPCHEICRISWNPILNMHCISPWHEICQISWPWNPPDFMKSAGFHVFAKWAKDQWSYFFWSKLCSSWEIFMFNLIKKTGGGKT